MGSGPPEKALERRRHRRFGCNGRAEVVAFSPELLFRGEVKDISLTGCFVLTRAHVRLRRFDEVELRFSANGHPFTSLARVTDVRPGKGVGVEFVAGDPRMNERFRTLLEILNASAESASKES
jgi:PilZ domain-containing protein